MSHLSYENVHLFYVLGINSEDNGLEKKMINMILLYLDKEII